MPDLIGHLVLSAGKRLPVGAGNDEAEPAMTEGAGNDGFRHARPDRASFAVGREEIAGRGRQ